jgi:hypothetical protein
MQRRSKVQGCAQVVVVLVLSLSAVESTTSGEEFRVQIPALAGTYAYGQSHGPASFDLGCYLASVAAIRVEITGTNTMGWWDGDDVEDHYHGPRGSNAGLEMNHTADWYLRWIASAAFNTNGPFNQTMTLHPQEADAGWSFLQDGTADLYVENPLLIGWGGMAISPQLTVSSLTVVVEGERLFKIISFSRGGMLCWSPMPTTGVVRVYSAPAPAGPWSIVATTASSNACCNVTLAPAANAAYLRAVYSNQ